MIEADIIICNADLVYAYNNLLYPSVYALQLQNKASSCSSISFYWGLDKTVPELKAHNIFLADEYRESFDSIFKEQLIPKHPSFYVNVPSRIDPSAAPKGKDAVVVLVPVGHLLSSKGNYHRGTYTEATSEKDIVSSAQDWDAMISFARWAVIETIRSRTGVDLESHIVHEQLNTPQTWKDIFNLDKGAILGLSHSFFNVLSFRPKTKHPTIKGLYFVGASTHPGTGVPIVLAGAKVVSEQVLTDHKMQWPWGPGGLDESAKKAGKGEGKKIDRVHWLPIISTFHIALVLFAFVMWVLLGTNVVRDVAWRLGKIVGIDKLEAAKAARIRDGLLKSEL